MSRPSAIDKLPPDVRDALNGWLRDPAITQIEATELLNHYLAERGSDKTINRHSVNRYDLKMRKVGERLRQSREVANMWIAKLGAEPQGKVGHLVNEVLRTLAFDLSMTMSEGEFNQEDAPAVAKMLRDMAIAMEKLERAASENVKRTEEIRRQEREAAAEKAVKIARKGGMTKETVEAIKAGILGVKIE